MATFDQLSAEQRAIIELVLKQGKSYEDLGETLGMPSERVKELARSALQTLSPVSAAQVDADWRGQIADYLLGQQSGGESTATRAHLRRSEAGRAWSRSLLDSLEQFYDGASVPTIPSGNGGGAPPSPGKKAAPSGDGDGAAPPGLSPEARRIVLRRRIAGGAAFALVALLALLVWPVGLLTGDDGDDKAGAEPQRPAPQVIGQLVLKPERGVRGAGVAVIAQRGKGRAVERNLIVQARLAPNENRQAYEVWLYNSDRDAKSLGAQVTDRQGTYQGAAELPKDFARYRFIDVSRESVDQNSRHSGQSMLRGRIADFAAPPPPQQQQGTQTQP